MRGLTIILLGLATAGVAAAANPPQPPSSGKQVTPLSAPVFVLTGGGNGHGVGLNQYGALAQAKANRTYREILEFYYPGTEIAKAPVSKVRVLIADGRTSARIGSPVPFSVSDATGTVTPLPAGELPLTPELTLALGGKPKALPGPLTFSPGKGGALSLDGTGYRGSLRVAALPGGLRVVDVVSLDAYVNGVVPGEVPKDWPAAALQAQAVAARSYALASITKTRDYDLHADPRSQMYFGVETESPATNAAVTATRGEILTYAGKVARTFYYSSSGGRTASSEDVFGAVTPYLQARDDPWDAVSPHHRWVPRSFTSSSLGLAFGLSSPIVDVRVVETASGRPASVTLVKQKGERVVLTAADVRNRLGLRSTAFRIGILRIGRPPAPVASGQPVVVSGIARDVEAPLLERLAETGAWVTVGKLVPAENGVFAVTVRPRATVTYRLAAYGQAGPALTITVAGQKG